MRVVILLIGVQAFLRGTAAQRPTDAPLRGCLAIDRQVAVLKELDRQGWERLTALAVATAWPTPLSSGDPRERWKEPCSTEEILFLSGKNRVVADKCECCVRVRIHRTAVNGECDERLIRFEITYSARTRAAAEAGARQLLQAMWPADQPDWHRTKSWKDLTASALVWSKDTPEVSLQRQVTMSLDPASAGWTAFIRVDLFRFGTRHQP